MSTQRFDELLGDALDLIPPELATAIDNVVVLVEDRDPEDPELLGLYQGIALTERDSSYAGALPDTITIYRDSLLEICDTEDDVVTEVAITVIHEIAHHFGIDDDRLHGWVGAETPSAGWIALPGEAVDVLAHVLRDLQVDPDGSPGPKSGPNAWYGPVAPATSARSFFTATSSTVRIRM